MALPFYLFIYLLIYLFIYFFIYFCRGVVALDMDLEKLDVDQCEHPHKQENLFAGSHKCRNTTQVSNIHTKCYHVKQYKPNKHYRGMQYTH